MYKLSRLYLNREGGMALGLTKKAAVLMLVTMLMLSSAWLLPALAGQNGTTLTVVPTANGSLEVLNVYNWTIDKSADTSTIEIKKGETKSITYTLNITRTGPVVTENGASVSGTIHVTNGGEQSTEHLVIKAALQKAITGGYEDVTVVDVSTSAMPVLGPKDSATDDYYYPYSINFTRDSSAKYRVVARVTITNHSGHRDPDVPFGPGYNDPQHGVATEGDIDFSTIHSTDSDASANVADHFVDLAGFTFNHDPFSVQDLHGSLTTSYAVEVTNNSKCGQNFTLSNTATLTKGTTHNTVTDSEDVIIETGACPSATEGTPTPSNEESRTSGNETSSTPTGSNTTGTTTTTATTTTTPTTPTTTITTREKLPFTGVDDWSMMAALILGTVGGFMFITSYKPFRKEEN